MFDNQCILKLCHLLQNQSNQINCEILTITYGGELLYISDMARSFSAISSHYRYCMIYRLPSCKRDLVHVGKLTRACLIVGLAKKRKKKIQRYNSSPPYGTAKMATKIDSPPKISLYITSILVTSNLFLFITSYIMADTMH